MPKPKAPTIDTLDAIASRMRDYTTCYQVIEWLADNKLITDANPEQLAYSFAIRFAQEKDALDAIIGLALKTK